MSTRRTLLKTSLLAGGVSVLGLGTGIYLHQRANERQFAHTLAQLLENTERAEILGHSLLSDSGAFQDVTITQINDELLRALDLDRQTVIEIEATLLLERMHARVEADFREENIVIVNGWLLSRTEARLCALSALSANT